MSGRDRVEWIRGRPASIAECGSPVAWPLAEFEASCWSPPCDNPGDPRSRLTIAAAAVHAEEPSVLRSWGRTKSEYR